MKGFVHFISGLAVASCIPQALDLAQRESSFILAWGGVFSILPDTMDFKFAQFWKKYDYLVDPDPENPDPQEIADTLAQAIEQAHDTKKATSIMLMTIKKSADLWREYKIGFDTKNNEISVRMGPLVNTSQKPFPGTEIKGKPKGHVKLKCKLAPQIYENDVKVDIMSGPSFSFQPREDGAIKLDFIPWHRNWSHSLITGVFFGALAWLLLGTCWDWGKATVYALVITVGFCTHVLEDQIGYMGSNLFWPLTREKTSGLKLMHSGDVWPNFFTVWVSLMLIFYNMNRFAPKPVFDLSLLMYCVYSMIIPLVAINIIERMLRCMEAQKKPA